MEWFISLGGAAAFSLVGAALLPLARQAVEGEAPPDRPFRFPPLRATALLLALTNLALAVLLPRLYGLSGPDVLRTQLACTLLWPCAWADARALLIPNRLLLVGAALGAALVALEVLLAPAQAAYLLASTGIAAGALLLGSLVCRLIAPRTVGMGDVKLLGVLGLCLGMDLVWTALFVSFLVLFVACLLLLATKRVQRSDSLPFAPFLLAGTIAAAVFFGI